MAKTPCTYSISRMPSRSLKILNENFIIFPLKGMARIIKYPEYSVFIEPGPRMLGLISGFACYLLIGGFAMLLVFVMAKAVLNRDICSI